MIRIAGMTKTKEWKTDLRLDQLEEEDLEWYWVDFSEPDERESSLLTTHFKFHPLAVEDCLHLLQRPKLDHYEQFHFLVLHAVNPQSLEVSEVNLFLGKQFLVTFHYEPSKEIEDARAKLAAGTRAGGDGPVFAAYMVIDKLVDQYFPAVQELEEQVLDLEIGGGVGASQSVMDDIFSIRARLLRMRKSILPMRELLYRLINTERITGMDKHLAFYHDIYDHLLKLAEMTDACREMTADLRDSYMSYNANRMNSIMKTLTVITTIFMPLTFIAGLYGMNFHFMPELGWHWGYFGVLGVMLGLGILMYAWFRRKGWFD
ncbi:magnesium/cobalt transporter CorA [Paenibacillus sp. NPDC058071]|uniref:magnesium/cobalt transporter CorA n=1 Tax=Paenibacillus sp. NPDC058071 TaxID=3346326 RepID=UPI0036DEA973